MPRPGFEPGPPAWEASTLEKSHLDSLSAGYSEPLLSRHLLTTFGPLQYVICTNLSHVSTLVPAMKDIFQFRTNVISILN
jgi:hypothetical protein